MFLLKLILVIFLIILGIRIIWAFISPLIFTYITKKMTQNINNEYIKRENSFQEKYNPEYSEVVHISSKVKIKIPHIDRDSIKDNSIIEDVDFEEMPNK
jgi:hypothetical protein